MNTLKASVAVSCAALVAAVLADATPPRPAPAANAKMTAQERIYKLGGYVVYPGSQKGSVAFIDTQGDVDVAADFEEVIGHFRRQVPVKLDFAKSEPGSPEALKAGAKADFAIVFVADASKPPTVVVPEEGYAVVNFARYTAGLKLPEDEAKYKRRCARAALKALVLLCGGGGSRYPGHVAAAHTPQELDFSHDKLPIDIQDSVKKYLAAAGVTAARRTIYQRACQEGWAPAPTNEYQKAIWEETRKLPEKPIQIKFDPKKGR